VDGSGGASFSTRTNGFGAFTFSPVQGGAYLVSASRRGFAPAQYGQKRWKGSGIPVFVEQNSAVTLVIRLPRFAAIVGTVLDDNEVGLQDHDVAAYRNTRPPQQVARAKTDDRGMFRLSGLDPGAYLVRTLAKRDEEETYLPTFYRDAATVEQAYAVTVDLDRQAENIDIHPAPGKLYTISGQASSSYSAPVTLTLVSDLGSETATTESSGAFRFNPVPPGQYELFAQAVSNNNGQYHFYGLAPGGYRVLSSYDFQAPDPLDLTSANAQTLRVQEGQDLPADLDLYVVR
jgi:hypothetical protein